MLVSRAESRKSTAPEKMSEPSFYTRETRAQLTTAKVYSEVASTQAVQSNGERVKRLPYCTMVSGQFDLDIGGAKNVFCLVATPLRKLKPLSDRAC
jgi:hypothetical protein